MRVQFHQLPSRLKGHLAAIYMVCGDEPLQLKVGDALSLRVDRSADRVPGTTATPRWSCAAPRTARSATVTET
mgnify:CR=1 FL=1